jgi:hypothetical protein
MFIIDILRQIAVETFIGGVMQSHSNDKSLVGFIYDQQNLCFHSPNKFLVSRSKTDLKLLAIRYIV